ncbi:MAG: PDZ domain-containing protein, partial [Acidobacteria bacterium]|nr:PDZ domain-containing protein [Acidobacteriota bacterium]
MQIDFDGLQNRIIAVPGVRERQYSALHAATEGTVFYLESTRNPPGGGQGGGSELSRYRLCDRRVTSFTNGVASYEISADGRKLLYRTAGGAGAAAGPPAPGSPPPVPSLFLIDTDRNPPSAGQGRLNATLRMYLDPRQEFKQIFDEGWRNQRDYLYVPNMHGTNWPKMKDLYGQFLPYVNHRADLNYLLDMMGAEIAIGHSYVRGGDMPDVPPVQGGLLGADFAIENDRYRVTRIYDNESWNPDLRAPLAAPGANVAVGDYVLAINGVELKAPDNIFRLLDGTANRQTSLTVNTNPSMAGARNVTVVPVASEQGLRGRAWVESNRRLVEKLSDGQLAYVYVPNTGQPGYSSFNRYYFSQQEKK